MPPYYFNVKSVQKKVKANELQQNPHLTSDIQECKCWAINKPVMLQKPMPQSIYIVYTFKDQIIVKSLLLQQTKHEQLEFSSRHLR